MGTENRPSFNESLSSSFKLAETFRKSGVLGEKTDQESKNVANEKVREILSTSFPVAPHAETQYNVVPQYESVVEMIAVSKDANRTDAVRNRAERALSEVGLALSQNKEILKAATEGAEELKKTLPSNLYEIQPYILSVILTNGKDDLQGKEMVNELVDLFKLKEKADYFPSEKNKKDFESKSDTLFDKLYDVYKSFGPKEIEDGTEGRIETMMGYIRGMDEKKKVEAKSERKAGTGQKLKNGETPERFEDVPVDLGEGGFNNEPGSPENKSRGFSYGPEIDVLANNFMEMDQSRFDYGSPPNWYKEMTDQREKDKIRVMAHLNLMCNLKNYNSGDLGKMTLMYLDGRCAFSAKMFNLIYGDPVVKKSMETFIRELCTFEKDKDKNKNDKKTLCFNIKKIKEKLGNKPFKDDKDAVSIFFDDFDTYKEVMALKNIYPGESDESLKNRLKLGNLPRDNKEYQFIRMKVASAWNFLYYSNLVESVDTGKYLKPSGEYLVDKARTLFNPLSKAFSKYQVEKTIKGRSSGILDKHAITGRGELFGTLLGLWATDRIKKDPKFVEKLKNGEISPFPERMCCSFVEFKETRVKKEDGSYMSMAECLKEEKEIKIEDSVLNLYVPYKDLFEGSVQLFNAASGKMKMDPSKDIIEWVTNIYDGLSLVRQSEDLGAVKMEYLNDKNLPNFLAYAIASSIGLRQGSSDLILSLPEAMYTDIVEGIVLNPGLGFLTKSQRKILTSKLNATEPSVLGPFFNKGTRNRKKAEWKSSFEKNI